MGYPHLSLTPEFDTLNMVFGSHRLVTEAKATHLNRPTHRFVMLVKITSGSGYSK